MAAQKPTYEELEQRVKELEKKVLTYECTVNDLDIEHRQLLSIFDSIDEPVYVSDPDSYELLFVNEALKEIWGNVIGLKCYKVLQGQDYPCSFCTNDRIFGEKAGRPYIWEFQNKTTGRTFHCIDKAIRWPDGRMVRYEMAIDITERKQAEEALRESENKYRDLVEGLNEAIYRMSLSDGKYEYVSPSAKIVFGYSAENFINDPLLISEIIHPDFTDYFQKKWAELISGEVAPNYEYKIIDPEGNERWILQSNKGIFDRQGNIIAIEGICREITKMKQAEKALQESEERYRAVVEDMPAMVCRFLPDGTLTFVNNAHGIYFHEKPADLIGQNFFRFISKEDRKRVRNHIISLNRETPTATYDHQVIVPDGTIRWQEWTGRALFDESGRVVEYQSIGKDITETKLAQQEKENIEKQLRQAQKMESIGTLAGGIAHDFNNILASVLGYTELAINKVKAGDHNVLDNLETVFQAGHRAKDLVHQILQFSRQVDTDFKPVGIDSIVREALKLLRASFPATIEIKWKIQPIAEKVMADGSQIHQVVMNLCTNAYHAMREKGGVLTVKLLKQEVLTPRPCHGSQIEPGTYAVLMIADTGHGMDAETRQRIFEPYFTTKAIREGTGLGLAVTKGIVAGHKGGIRFESTPGEGSVFTLYFPLITRWEEDQTFELLPIKGGTERILFVDDEKFFVGLGSKILTDLGYDVITANESLTALEIFASQSHRFDLVITDQTMPKMTGLQLARKLNAVRPDLPVIICTGFSENINGKTAKQIGVSHILHKPVTRRDLALAVRKVLDNG